MTHLIIIFRTVCISLLVMLMQTGFSFAAEIDDSAIFVDAFSAYQRKDYLTAIEKADQLNQMFPDSPLRDVALLLIARSGIKSGDNERAAKAVASFNSEFAESSLKTTIEEDLLSLAVRHQKGEKLAPNKQLQAAAQKVLADRLAKERAIIVKLEQERLAREKIERERIAREKFEAERRATEKAAAEKAQKDAIKVVINIIEDRVVEAGETGSTPFEVSNRGKNSEEFVLESSAPEEYAAIITSLTKTDTAVTRIKLAAGETFKGNLTFRMPSDKVDGNRTKMTVKVSSAVYSDIFQQKSILAITSAPLIRVVSRLPGSKVSPGEELRYRVNILNVGSMTAQSLTVRLQLPVQLELLGIPEMKFNQEPDGTIVFMVDQLSPGKLAEINLDVKVRNNSEDGQKLNGRVEVINGKLQRKDIFPATVSKIQLRQKQK